MHAMHVSMSPPARSALCCGYGGIYVPTNTAIHFMNHTLIAGIIPELTPKISYRIFEAIEFAAEVIELGSAKSHVTGTGGKVFRLQYGCSLIKILPLVRRVVRA